MAVYAEDLGRKAGGWKAVAAESLTGFVLRVAALLIIAAAMFTVLAAANVAQQYWPAPVQEEPILIPTPSGENNTSLARPIRPG